MAEPEQTAPSDNTTLQAVLDGYVEAGFASNFGAQEAGIVRCDTCGSELDAGTAETVPWAEVRDAALARLAHGKTS